MKKERKHYTAEEKVNILRRHLLDKVPVSDLCEGNGLQPTVFYRWQKEFFENGAAAFEAKERPARQVEEKQKRIEFLEKKVQTKDEVLAELMAEIVALLGFVIAAQIDPDEPSAVASCNDLANFASHRVSSLARKRGTQLAHSCGIKARIFRLIEQRVADRPSVRATRVAQPPCFHRFPPKIRRESRCLTRLPRRREESLY